MADLQGARRRRLGVVAQGDGLSHEDGIDLVESPVQAHGAVLHDAAFGLEEEQVVEVEVGAGVTHVFACERPLLERGAPVDAAMGRLVVLALDPGPEAAVERLEARGGIGVEAFEPGGAKRSEEALDFPLSRWLPGASVNERDAELGAHEGELVRAVVGTVIDVKSQRQAPAGERALEHRQERGGALGEVEGGEGERAGGIVDKGNEEGLSAPAPIADLRSVHDIAHPQLAGVAEGEASPVDGDGLAGVFVEKAFAREQPMHRRGSQRALDPALARRADEGVDRERGLLGLQPHEQLGDVGGQAAGPAAVDTGLRIQRLEAAAAVQRQPIADGLGGDAGAPRAGDGVGVVGLLTQPLADARCARGEMGEVGNQPVAEQSHGLAQFVIAVVQERGSRRCGVIGPRRRVRYAGRAGGSAPTLCWKRRLRIVEPRRWGWNPNGAGSTGSCAALSARIATRALSVPSRVRTAPTSATHRSSCSGSNPMTRSRAWWTSSTRRWTQRIAPASPTGSRRNALAAALTLAAPSACATTASTSSSSPGSRAARQSGSRLKVVWLSGQYQRAICVPRGVLRA